MRELTQSMPKPMVEVCGKPILNYIVEGLRDAGIGKILVVVGYRKEVVQDHFHDGSDFGVEITYAEQVAQDGTGKVVELAQPFWGPTRLFSATATSWLIRPVIFLSPTR